MSKIISVVGARPNFIKLDSSLPQIIVHTGQHYDDEMSAIFFRDLHLPKPKYNLGVNDCDIGNMIQKLTEIFQKEKPRLVIVYGDANSTAAGAIAAYQKRIPVAHVEAGLRSSNRRMLEEYNRIISDHIATLNFCPTRTAVENLKREGLTNMYLVGDVMYDRILPLKKKFKKGKRQDYIYLTCHRAENVDDKQFLFLLFRALGKTKRRIIFPVHPRTKQQIKTFRLKLPDNIEVVAPLGYEQGLQAMTQASVVITDSGGMQKEAYFLGRPCLILRRETEWPEIVDGKSILLVPPEHVRGLEKILSNNLQKPRIGSKLFGDGHAWKKIKQVLKKEGFL